MEAESSADNWSAEETAKKFQVFLRKYEKDEKLMVLEALSKPGSKLGDNYTSVMIRTQITGTRGDGSAYRKSFMVKTVSQSRPIAGMMSMSKLFLNEGQIYRNVLPHLGNFGPRCVYFDENNIIMQDLGEDGYGTCDRRKFLDAEHTVFALKTLAKYHASSLAMKINNPRKFEELCENVKEVIYIDDYKEMMEQMSQLSSNTIIEYLKKVKPQTEEMKAITEIFTGYINKIFNTFSEMFNGPKQKYYTICHGDPWLNNFLFLHNDKGKVIDLKLIDYQIGRHFSVASDIHYLIYTSVHTSLIENSYESLIKIYHTTLLDELRSRHVSEKVLAELGPEWLEGELQLTKLYGAICGCWVVHALLAEDSDLVQFEKSLDMDPKKVTETPEKIDRVKCIAMHFYRRLQLGIIKDDLKPIVS